MSTNNQLSGHRQEDVKRVPSVPHDKQKIQGAEKYAMDHAHDDFYKKFKPDSELVKKMKNKQDIKTPTDCCNDCGKKYGKVPTRAIGVWNGTCSICGSTNVTCADAGHDYRIWEMPNVK